MYLLLIHSLSFYWKPFSLAFCNRVSSPLSILQLWPSLSLTLLLAPFSWPGPYPHITSSLFHPWLLTWFIPPHKFNYGFQEKAFPDFQIYGLILTSYWDSCVITFFLGSPLLCQDISLCPKLNSSTPSLQNPILPPRVPSSSPKPITHN